LAGTVEAVYFFDANTFPVITLSGPTSLMSSRADFISNRWNLFGGYGAFTVTTASLSRAE
jgi:hypothetical protein